MSEAGSGIELISRALGIEAGFFIGYSPGSTCVLPVLTAVGGITGLSPSPFILTGAFTGLASVSRSAGVLVLTIAAASVPEIDLQSFGSVLSLVLGSRRLYERRQLRQRSARQHAAA
jgi:hypothetical protein